MREHRVDPRVVRAKERLDSLDWWPRPVRVARVHVSVTPWFFRLPYFRRFDGFAYHCGMLLRSDDVPDGLIVHELCHIWQMQHRPFRMPVSYLAKGYWRNPYEIQARAAVDVTAPRAHVPDPL